MKKTTNKKQVKIPEADYQRMRRDQKAKVEVRGLALMLYDKVKNWK
jgi:hypothetical protein